jgi:hypothetical protein
MSEISKQNSNFEAVPFFARYLEGQIEELSEEEMEAAIGGSINTTLKYPSDMEDAGSMTKKYPSDTDVATTDKYPSDGDDDPQCV